LQVSVILEEHQLLNQLDLQTYYQKMQSSSILMSYKGAASNDLLTSILAIAQSKLAELENKSVIKKRVFTILVEIIQNIYHHFADVEVDNLHEDDSIAFVLSKIDDTYIIITGNYVANADVPALKNRIDEVNAMDAEQLKEKYRETLNTGEISAKGGAGLGIIDIARRSGSKLEYSFRQHSPKYSFFNLIVKISAL
jgi:hypothetical protein